MQVTYNRLTLVEPHVGRSKDGRIMAKWRCQCGSEAVIAYSRVKSGSTKSCGCLVKDASVACNTRHGKRNSPEYYAWTGMRQRCHNPKSKDFAKYGGRGISVCSSWSSFEQFFADVGPRPDGTTLDRIDTNGNYEPGNVRWASHETQQRNRRSNLIWHIKGLRFEAISDAAAHFGVSEHTISRWVNGAFDARRNSYAPPRPDCLVEERYQ